MVSYQLITASQLSKLTYLAAMSSQLDKEFERSKEKKKERGKASSDSWKKETDRNLKSEERVLKTVSFCWSEKSEYPPKSFTSGLENGVFEIKDQLFQIKYNFFAWPSSYQSY